MPPPKTVQPASRATALRVAALLLLVLPALSGCQRDAAPAPAGKPASRSTAPAQPARRPVDAVHVLAARLQARDGAGFARLAVPPALHGRLVEGWSSGRTQWPLDELPLDARIPRMLASLQAPNADKALMATFRRQFAGADRDIDQAVRTLVQFGGEYVRKDADYTPEEREHVGQVVVALGEWALAAPFQETPRAQRFFTALSAAAIRSGVEGRRGTAAYAALGMTATLDRLSPFFATLLAQLRQQYGLDLDASLRGVQVRLLEQTGDTARLRLQYPLAGQPIDAVVPVVRIDGHWYLADYVARAEASLLGQSGNSVRQGID